ncbi:MAG: gliding motility-associated C-terminal domain-containing protein [Bacteroidetes bacterium]|nr:gliding motility-associated C-terminal domain-containing protein [Bacteroidota bacterium]
MNKIVLIFCLVFFANLLNAQSNDCSSATVISPNASCVNMAGTTAGATQSIPGCVGTADDDVWYQFTASATSHQVTVTASAGFDPVVQLFSGTCAALTTISCMDNGLTGDDETIYATGLTIGQVYRLRVYHYYAGAPTTPTFSICVTNPPPVPSNNNCSGATPLTVNTSCTTTAGTSVGATLSTTGCAGNADDDVWYSFVATNSVQTITVDPSATMDPVVELYTGTCASLTSLECMDNGFTDGTETINAVGLTPGSTYYVRVYDYYSSTGGDPFTICVVGAATSAPVNDEPCNAIQWPAVTTECDFLPFTTTGATTTATPGTPSATCQNWNAGTSTYIAPTSGGFGAGTKDVWFRITVPATGNITITIQPGLASPTNDMVFALYSGACGSLTQFACSDDYNYPGSSNDLQPFLNQTGLTPGSTVYVRVFCYGTTNFGNFGMCVTTNTNDACANALYICDLNGYSASTSAAFTPDRPGTGAGQMYGNNETAAGVNQTDGTNTAGPFGYYPPTNIAGPYSSPDIDVNIENNSWIRFTAGATTAVLNVTVGDCFVGGYPSGGIQMQIFSATACNNFVPVSQFRENSTGFTITASGLTVGNDYYLMVDGYANDVCNYTISANSGVQFPDIVASANPICNGASTILTAPSGSSSYEWYPGGEITQAITVSPSTTTTYTCIVSGVCGQRQSLTKTITVNQLPSMTSSTAPAAICSGTSVGLTLTSSIPSTYSWLAANNADVTGESTSAVVSGTISNTLTVTSLTNEDVIYTITPTSTAINGSCPGPAQTVTVTVKPLPTLTDPSNQTVCAGAAIAATNFVTDISGTTVAWVNTDSDIGISLIGAGNIATYTAPVVTSAQTGTITATPTLNSCSGSAQLFTITVNPTPQFTATVNNQSICGGANTNAVSFAYSPSSGGSIAWTNTNANSGITGVGLTSASGSGNIGAFTTPMVTATQTTVITATPTIGTCSGTAQSFTITVNPTPVLTDPSNQTVCGGASIAATNFSSTPAATVNWVNSNSGSGVNGIGITSAIGSGNIATYTSPLVTTAQTGTIVATPVLGSCTGSSQTFTITVNPTPVISAVTNTTVCGNSNVAAINFTASPTTSVSWTSSSTSTGLSVASGTGGTPSFTAANVTSVTTSTITLNATLNSCAATAVPYTITVNPLPRVTGAPTVTQSACGLSTGALNNIAVTGTGALTYVWTNSTPVVVGGNSNSITNQPAGSYNVTVTDNFNCPVTFGPYSITNPGAPAAPTVSANDNTLCVGQLLNLTGTSSATSFSWTGPNSSSSTSSLSIGAVTLADAGTYTLTVTESNCTSSNTINITVNANPTAAATSSNPAYCTGSAINLFGSGGTSYSWTGPNTYSSTDQNPTITGSTIAADGTYSLTVTDANGCTAQSTVAIDVNQTPSDPLTTGSSSAICEGETINLFASSTNATSYGWVGPNVFISADQNPTITNASANNAGIYTVIATGSGCNSNPVLVNVVVNPNPNATLGVSANPLCSGQDVTLTASGASNIVWDYLNTVGGTLQINNVQVSNAGYYAVEITDGVTGCSDRDSILLTVNQTPEQPILAVAADTVLCEGEDLALIVTSTGATTFTWTGPNGFTATTANADINNVVNVNGGVYTVTASTAFCSSIVRDVTVVVNDTSTAYASAAATTICSGNTISLVGVVGTGSEWTGPNGFTSTNANETITNATTAASGLYTYTSINNPGDCRHSATVNILVNETPVLDPLQASDDSLCEGENLILTASSANGTIYSWTGPNGYTSTNAAPQINAVVGSNSGTYTVTVSNGLCTSNAATISIVVNDTATAYASAAATTLCSGNNIVLNGQGGNSSLWTGPNGFTSTNQNETITNASTLASGTYTYSAINNPGNCTHTASVTILVNETPADASVLGASTCTGASLNLTASATGTVTWYSDSTLTNLVNTGNTYSPALATNTVDTFYVVVANNGCTSNVQSVIASNYNIVAAISASPDSGSVPLPVVFTNNSIGVDSADTYQWIYNGTTFSTTQHAANEFQQGGSFNVMMIATDNQSGCKDTAYVTIFVDDEIRVIIPNIFTPNGDGTNDVFSLDIKGAKEAKGSIYNRWGSLLYEWDAINSTWDGKLTNGELVSDGVYFYIIKIVGYNGDKLDVPGNVTIVK